MFTNDLKKGNIVRLKNGWFARIEDNKKGNTRLATVYGNYTEMGSVYSHDIAYYYRSVLADGKEISLDNVKARDGSYETVAITLNDSQLKLARTVGGFGL